MKDNYKKVLLIIVDGWGIPENAYNSAIAKAKTPFLDSLFVNYPYTSLKASGKDVGLPDEIMGNSEVGHLNIGAGRIIKQSLIKINEAISENKLEQNPIFKEAINYLRINQKKIHLLGLISNGGVHSHIDHYKAFLDILAKYKINNIYLHYITDGRDSAPYSSINFIEELESHIKKASAKIATITGRYFAMDRDKRWNRTKIAYDCLVFAKGKRTNNWKSAIIDSYENGITDEFIEPIILTDKNNKASGSIDKDDVLFFLNFRPDRARQLTEMLSQKAFVEYDTKPLRLKFITLTKYKDDFKNIEVLFGNEILKNTLGEVISNNNLKQLRIAETEKYPHVTYFFSGGNESPYKGEERILCPSPRVKTYDLQPEMSADCIKNNLIRVLNSRDKDFICSNFANLDMVGHTGNLESTIKAVEKVDECIKDIIETALKNDYTIIVTSDHGNAEEMVGQDGAILTSHTINEVPLILIDKEKERYKLKGGRLSNISPTILDIMKIKKPEEMHSTSLLIDNSY